MTPPIESAAACPKCGRNYEFVTSGPLSQIPGQLRAVHPLGPCVPPKPRPVEFDLRADEKQCAGCGEAFRQKRVSQLYCVPRCRYLHVRRKKPQWFRCIVCESEFKSTRQGRTTCSHECRMEYRLGYFATYNLLREVRAYKQNRRAA